MDESGVAPASRDNDDRETSNARNGGSVGIGARSFLARQVQPRLVARPARLVQARPMPPHPHNGTRAPPNAIRIFVDGGFVAVRIATELRAAGIGRPWPALERVRAKTLKALSVDNT